MEKVNDGAIVDPSGRPAREALRQDDRCPQCGADCPEGDETRRRKSGGFGNNVRDLCRQCGFRFDVLTVTK